MITTSLRRPLHAGMVLLSAAAVAVASTAIGADAPPVAAPPAEDCPPGFMLTDRAELLAEQRLGSAGDDAGTKSAAQMLDPICMSVKHPESFAEMKAMQDQRAAVATAPFNSVPPGAYRAAVREHQRMLAAPNDIEGSDGDMRPLGETPLISNDERFNSVNGLGLAKLNGRVDSLVHDEDSGRVFALIGTGGVWMSEDMGASWEDISSSLPSQIVGALDWSEANGGTLIAVAGEHLMGGNTYTGLGAYWSDDLGTTWHNSTGVPDGALGFQVAVDPTDEEVVYVATSQGLFRSANAGRTFVDMQLPVGEVAPGMDCAGDGSEDDPYDECQFANFVTDVVVLHPGGVNTDKTPGRVVAAVGYRASNLAYAAPGTGEIHAPGNGIYISDDDGATWTKGEAGFPALRRRGRIELGPAVGEAQDHDYLYAIVQDARLFNCGITHIDAPEALENPNPVCANTPTTSINGIYVSDDFGESWVQMADTNEIAHNDTTHTALTGAAATSRPGIQAWYNEWIQPDPTMADADGVPTRLAFGLEEVWANRCPNPQNTSVQLNFCDIPGGGVDPEVGDFEVVGKYFANRSCYFLSSGLPVCPNAEDFTNPALTTHPDQHDGLWVPDGDGGVHLLVGNDGGVYVQHIAEGDPIAVDGWGEGNNDGFHTLLPYAADVAKDGRVWYGMQDNGSGYIDAETGAQYMTFGGDGMFAEVDPDNSDYAWTEIQNGGMRSTIDGGQTWRSQPPSAGTVKFSNPYIMDPLDSNHLMTAGTVVRETISGHDTCTVTGVGGTGVQQCRWTTVFELGTVERDDGAGTVPNTMSAVDLYGDNAYVGTCGVCDILNNTAAGFHNGIATNVGGDAPPERMTRNGWHFAAAEGLPNRYITAIKIDPEDPETIYVTLGGYANRQWVPPGSYLDPNEDLGEGHVYVSHDAGETFENISGNLPNIVTQAVELHGDQLLVGNDLGVYLSEPLGGAGPLNWVALDDIPNVVISTIRNHPGDPDKVVIATFGRGVYEYDFNQQPDPTPTPTTSGSPTGSPSPTGGPTTTTSPDVGATGGTTGDPNTPETGGGAAALALAALATSVILGRRLTRRR